MCIYICTNTHAHAHAHAHAHTHKHGVCVCVFLRICVCIFMYLYTYTHAHTLSLSHTHTHTHTHTHCGRALIDNLVHTHTHTHAHTHTHHPTLWIMLKYLRAGPSKMPLRSWYNCGTNHFDQADFCLAEMREPTMLSIKRSTAWSGAENQIFENKILGTGF